MYKYKFQICELAHAQIEEKRGVPAGICRSCIHDPKVVARNTKIDQQIYLLTAGKGLNQSVRGARLKLTSLSCTFHARTDAQGMSGSVASSLNHLSLLTPPGPGETADAE